jgi:hypothetical protein
MSQVPRSGPYEPRRPPARSRGRAVVVATVLVVSGLGFVGVRVATGLTGVAPVASEPPAALTSDDTASDRPTPSVGPASPSPAASTPEAIPSSFPRSGPGTWRYAGDQGPVLGTAGRLQRFRVAVETNVSVDLAAFAAKVDQTLGDARSWIAGGTLRLQRVPGTAAYDFTIHLATRSTSTKMCAAGGTDTGSYTSCRTVGKVILNLDRWYLSVPDYVNAKVPLDVYRSYMINHETGHQFGHGHELCPGAGRPAPVMEQQTLGLHGCVANPWPYLDGRRYAGPPGHY